MRYFAWKLELVLNISWMIVGPYWNAMWFLLISMPNSDWLFNHQGLIMLLCWQQICAFQFLLFKYKLPQLLRDKLESFRQFFCNGVSNSVPFFLLISPSFFRSWAILFWKCIDFVCPSRRFSTYNSFIGMLQVSFFQKLKVHIFIDVCTEFLN